MTAAESIFDWLQGEWAFVREIPGYASVRGRARIAATGVDTARYEETAVVSLAQGGVLRATQSYRYRRIEPPVNGLEVYFESGDQRGELFERLEFRLLRDDILQAQARFVCAADVYESVFAVHPDGRLRVEHAVHGPRKNYRVETIYRRAVRAV